MVKSSCSGKLKSIWEEDENGKMLKYGSNGTGNWTTFSKRSGQRRSGKSSREKWISNQKEDSRHKSFTPQEEELVIQLHAAIGSRWPIIAQQLPGKTDNDVKILWNSKLRKKLSAMGIDPVTHKPFSQILADYGNIGAFPKARTRFSSLSRDLKNAIIFKSEQQQQQPQPFPNSDNQFSPAVKTEPFALYSQLQAINLVTEATNYTKSENTTPYFLNECASSSDSPSVNQEISSFSWSDFLLEDAYLNTEIDGEEDKGTVLERDGRIEGKERCGEIENGGFEVSSSSFVEAMLERQDEMFPQLPGFYEEIFYY